MSTTRMVRPQPPEPSESAPRRGGTPAQAPAAGPAITRTKPTGLTAAFHEHGMRLALREAVKAAQSGEVPAGCVILRRPTDPLAPPLTAHLLARAHNQTELLKDPTAHAEMIAITQAAAAVRDWRLTDTILYVTKEPCPMCAGAIVLARIPVVVFGVPDPKRGGAISVFNILAHPNLNHRPQIITGVLEHECRDLLQQFFRERRQEGSAAKE